MVGLIDIAPARTSVQIGVYSIEVTGVTVEGIAHLLGRFSELRELMAGREVSADRLLAAGGAAVAAIIAAGTGKLGDAAHEAAAGSLAVDEQLELLAAIISLTFPRGAGRFLDQLAGLSTGLLAAAAPAKASHTSSPSPPSN